MNNYERLAKMMREAVNNLERTPEDIVKKEKEGHERQKKVKVAVVRQRDILSKLPRIPPENYLTEWEKEQEEREDRLASAMRKRAEEGRK